MDPRSVTRAALALALADGDDIAAAELRADLRSQEEYVPIIWSAPDPALDDDDSPRRAPGRFDHWFAGPLTAQHAVLNAFTRCRSDDSSSITGKNHLLTIIPFFERLHR